MACDHKIHQGDIIFWPFKVEIGEIWTISWCKRCGAIKHDRPRGGEWELPDVSWHCRACGTQVREGLLYCPGMGLCWWNSPHGPGAK